MLGVLAYLWQFSVLLSCIFPLPLLQLYLFLSRSTALSLFTMQTYVMEVFELFS